MKDQRVPMEVYQTKIQGKHKSGRTNLATGRKSKNALEWDQKIGIGQQLIKNINSQNNIKLKCKLSVLHLTE